MTGRVDLNCDLGEGAGQDEALMPLITSANIACGGHAGDPETMKATAEAAQRHGVAIGAHPGYADRESFGRRERRMSPEEVRDLVATQIEALRAIAPVRHVKPHGALYNLGARDAETAHAIASAVRAIDRRLILFGLAGSALLEAGRAAGLRVASEVFADRTYQPDGSLTPRTQPNALIENPRHAVAQALRMALEGRVSVVGSGDCNVVADTICLHGDGPHAVTFARDVRMALVSAGVRVAAISAWTP